MTDCVDVNEQREGLKRHPFALWKIGVAMATDLIY